VRCCLILSEFDHTVIFDFENGMDMSMRASALSPKDALARGNRRPG
jgi:hypothetical protein